MCFCTFFLPENKQSCKQTKIKVIRNPQKHMVKSYERNLIKTYNVSKFNVQFQCVKFGLTSVLCCTLYCMAHVSQELTLVYKCSNFKVCSFDFLLFNKGRKYPPGCFTTLKMCAKKDFYVWICSNRKPIFIEVFYNLLKCLLTLRYC